MEKLYLVMEALGVDLTPYNEDEALHDKLQSLVYLLSAEGGPLDYDFEIYKIGPYSQHVNMEAQKIAGGAKVEGKLTLSDKEMKVFYLAKEALVKDETQEGFLKCLSLVSFLEGEGFNEVEAIEEIIRETTHYDFSDEEIKEAMVYLDGYRLD